MFTCATTSTTTTTTVLPPRLMACMHWCMVVRSCFCIYGRYAQGSNNTCPDHDPVCWGPGTPAEAALQAAVSAASRAQTTVLVVGLGTAEGEGRDRVNMTLPPVQVELVNRIVKQVATKDSSNHLVIVVVAAGGVDLGDDVVSAASSILCVWMMLQYGNARRVQKGR